MQRSHNYNTISPEISLCPVCQRDYDSRGHTPKILFCGHTVCFGCIDKISFSEDRLKCPFCRKLVPRLSDGNNISADMIFLSIIGSNINERKEIYEEHQGYKKDHMCLGERCKICSYCPIYGMHEDPRTLMLKDFAEQVEKKRRELEMSARDFEIWNQEIDRMFDQEKGVLKKHISEIFDKMLRNMSYRQNEILREIDRYFNKEARKIRATDYYIKNQQIISNLKRHINEMPSTELEHFQYSVLETLEHSLIQRPFELELDFLKGRISQFSDPIYNNLNQLTENRLNDLNKLTRDFESTLSSFSLLGDFDLTCSHNNYSEEHQIIEEHGGRMNLEPRDEISICIMTFEGPYEMKVKLDDNILSIKQKIGSLGDAYRHINLFYENKPLKDSLSIIDYNIQSHIPLIVKSLPRYICI